MQLPLGISTEIFSTPLFTVLGRPCSVALAPQSSVIVTGWQCTISLKETPKEIRLEVLIVSSTHNHIQRPPSSKTEFKENLNTKSCFGASSNVQPIQFYCVSTLFSQQATQESLVEFRLLCWSGLRATSGWLAGWLAAILMTGGLGPLPTAECPA